jgi:iron complex outermembrane recepter protein
LVAQRVGNDQYVGVNAGKTLNRGIEFLVKARTDIAHNWSVEPFIAASIGQYEFKEFVNNDVDYSGKELTGVPKNKINAGFTFTMPHGLYLTADYYYVDRIPLNDANSVYSDSYNLVNAKAGWSKAFSIGKNHDVLTFNLSAGINNIANTHYAGMVLVNATGFNGAQPRYYYPGLPVNYYGTVGVSYGF